MVPITSLKIGPRIEAAERCKNKELIVMYNAKAKFCKNVVHTPSGIQILVKCLSGNDVIDKAGTI